MKHNSSVKILLIFLLLSAFANQLAAQKDTIFWFVAPEITKGSYDYDSPSVFRISSYDTPCDVKISMPANPAFTPISITMQAGESQIVDLGSFTETIENKPPNQILKKGILIESTGFITVYYEVIGAYQSNPEIYALKGQNALGTEFYIPLQNIIENSNAYSPLPHSAFDIVAAEDNTTITITPTKAIVGHAANTSFNIVLNRGQTYNSEAAGQGAAQHPTGSHVVSNKPIAITIKDDLLESGLYFGGFCRDQMGDQIIPVEQTGRRYVVQKGLIDGDEKAIVVGTVDNTSISKNGIPLGLLNAGQSMVINIDIGANFLEASAPVYVHQVSGNGCEVAGEIIPSLDCSGSRSVRFVRTNNEDFILFVITAAGNQDAFTVNGDPSILTDVAFQAVPGSNGEFVATAHLFPANEIIPGLSTEVSNSKGKFHLGFLNGAPSGTGCRLGFFSDFLNKIATTDTVRFCVGDTIRPYGVPIWTAGNYQSTISHGTATDCDTLVYITALSKGKVFNTSSLSFCEGSTVVVNGTTYSQPGIVIDTIQSTGAGCDTIVTTLLSWKNQITTQQELLFCPGSNIVFNGVSYNSPQTILDTIPSLSNTCDTVRTTFLKWLAPPLTQTIQSICKGDTLVIGSTVVTSPISVTDTIAATSGCDTLRTTTVQWAELPQTTRKIFLCPGDSTLIGGKFYHPGEMTTDTIQYPEICDTVRIVSIEAFENQALDLVPDLAVYCPGDPLIFSSPYPYTLWNKTISNASFTVSMPGIVTVYFLDDNECPHRDTVDIKSCCSEKTMYVPNAFTPDSDPPNNTFKAYSVEPCATYIMRIYDRWGELLFVSDDPSSGWDGYFRGKVCDSGVYVWVLEVTQTGQAKPALLKGDITIIR